eukprot:scaffold770_cov109-Cylindrotheca_fusiformis.AAC.5
MSTKRKLKHRWNGVRQRIGAGAKSMMGDSSSQGKIESFSVNQGTYEDNIHEMGPLTVIKNYY